MLLGTRYSTKQLQFVIQKNGVVTMKGIKVVWVARLPAVGSCTWHGALRTEQKKDVCFTPFNARPVSYFQTVLLPGV